VKEYVIERATWISREISEVFPFFAAAENLGRITPPELGFRIRSAVPVRMAAGTLIDYTINLYRIPMRWRTEITEWDPPVSFQDTQIAGPYAKWVHTHRFVANDARGGTTIEDRIVYALPFGALGRLVHPLVQRQLNRIFDYREGALRRELAGSRGAR
jgi:ligand-binding SRPBCC domain-containing protein